MPDLLRFLPLSQGARRDESGVDDDRRHAVADLIVEAAKIFRAASVDTARSFDDMFLREAGITVEPGVRARRAPDAGDEVDLVAVAELVRSGRRQPVVVLTRTLRALLLLSDRIGATPRVDSLTSGSVALYVATTTTFDRRAAIGGSTVRATDADWEFGHGPVIEGPSLDIVRFLVGLSDIPPRRPPSRRS